MTPAELARMEELLAAATAAPWCEHPNGTSIWTGIEYDSSGVTEQTMLFGARVSGEGYHDVALVVELRNNASSLLSASRALAELREALPGLRMRHAKCCPVKSDEPEATMFPCDCGADEHNARLLALLKEPAT